MIVQMLMDTGIAIGWYLSPLSYVTGLTVRALDGSFYLREGVDYSVSYKNNKSVTSGIDYAQLIIKGKGNYGTKTIPFRIVKKELSDRTVYVIPAEIRKDKILDTERKIAKKKTAKPKVIDAVTGKALTVNKDYTYEYGSYDEKQNAFSITIRAASGGNYSGSFKTIGYHIYTEMLKANSNIAINPNSKFYYTGKAITLTADDFVSWTGYAVLGKDFEIIEYKNNIVSGTAQVTVRAIGDKFGGTAKLSFKILKAKKGNSN